MSENNEAVTREGERWRQLMSDRIFPSLALFLFISGGSRKEMVY